ncbi:SRPBCC family protein [Naasia lichenicola]|uniref:SRPBCC family protein n=1 Tax=Naasia lichenicola TaxID=2565933 RepID=UPI001E5B2A13|nr:SRPBCC family protein [Naasia lichenicola]
MAVVIRTIAAEPEAVFRVLANGWLYPAWVVGAARMRGVDDAWPEEQSALHHSFGSWPFLLNDKTVSLEWDPPRRARMRARGWPIGEAEVIVEVKRRPDGCVVRLTEDAVEGPGRLVPGVIRTIGITIRNRETLRRLAFLAEGGGR